MTNQTSTDLVVADMEKNMAVVVRDDLDEPPRTSSLKAPNLELIGHKDAVYTVRFSPDGQHLATAGMDTNIFLWDVYGDCDNYALLEGHKNAVLEVAWNFDGGEVISVGADKNVIIWDAALGRMKRKLKGHASFVNGIDASKKDDGLLVSCSDDGTCKLWDERSHECVKTLPHAFQVTSCCFNEDTTQIITGGLDGIIRVYEMNTFTPSIILPQLPDMVSGIRLAPDGGYLLSNSLDAGLRVWDINAFFEGESRCLKLMRGHKQENSGNLLRCAWSPDLSMATCGSSDGFVYIYDTTSLGIKYRLPGHKSGVNDVDFHPIEPIICSVSSDHSVIMGEILP